MNRRRPMAVLCAILGLTAAQAFAACTNPAGSGGDIMYSSVNAAMFYCNNSSWIVMGSNTPTGLGSLTTGAFCTAASGSQINCTTGSIGLASQVTGTLPVANGGTGATSFAQGSIIFAGAGGILSQSNANLFWDNTNARLGIGTTASIYTLDIRGASPGLGVGTYGAADAHIEVGENATGNHYAYIDLTGDTTYTDFGLRMIRNNTGANTNSEIMHRGTGIFYLTTNEAAPLVFRTSASERMRIDSSGNVGIGTTSPSGKFHVYGVNGGVFFTNTDFVNASAGSGAYLATGASSGSTYTELQAFTTGNTVNGTLVLNPFGGNVGIGTTAPQAVLEVDSLADTQILNHLGGSTTNFYTKYSVGGTVIGSVTSGGGWTNVAYNTTSDRRLKENIWASARGISELEKIDVREFNFIADPNKKRVQGFIAQDLYEVYPEAVTVGGEDPKKHPWSVDYGRITPLLVKSIQELKADNDNLRDLVAEERRLIEMQGHHIDARAAKLQADHDNLQRELDELKASRRKR